MNLEAWKILTEGCTPDGSGATSFGEDKGNGYSIEVETALALYGLVRRFQPMSTLETGTHVGVSGATISLALNDACILYPKREPGVLLTIDMTTYDGAPEKLWERLNLRNIIHVIEDSEHPVIAKRYLDQMPPLEFVWLDADHAAEAIWREYQSYVSYFSGKRCILGFHDTSLDERMDAGVKMILADLEAKRADGSGWKNIAYVPFRSMRGLDLIYLSNEDI